MRLNFCTLFDSSYLTRGLVMYESLIQYSSDFHLYIFAFDDKTREILAKLSLSKVTVISLSEFEDEELLKVKSMRSVAEYCWTCTPSAILYCIQKYQLDNCTYLDSDLLFYSDPKVLIDEMGEDSVLITEHRYSPEYNQIDKSGKYCVQFLTFKNDERGINVLNWWRDQCLKWCYARSEDGKFGDQKYLDDWPTRFDGIHELKHIGGGVAPWNLQQYVFFKKDNVIFLKENISGKSAPLIFFHFHHLKFYSNEIVKITSDYLILKKVINYLYFPYIRKLIEMKGRISKIDSTFDPNGAQDPSSNKPFTIWDKIHLYKTAVLKFNFKEIMTISKYLNLHNYFSLKDICE